MEILFRLLNEIDGKLKVVGYEKWENGKWWHSVDGNNWSWIFQYYVTFTSDIKNNDTYATVNHNNYIPHIRKDMYTGIEIDGEKVFENDEYRWFNQIEDEDEAVTGWVGEPLKNKTGTSWPHIALIVNDKTYDWRFKITGIKGAKGGV